MLEDLLAEYGRSDVTPFHMPGHKRNAHLVGGNLPYQLDITEIDGFDNLQDPQGVLKETAELAARLYSSRKAYPLVNGSTGGILAAVRAAIRPGDTVIMARGCHKSVYSAVEINQLHPVYLVPDTEPLTGITGSIRPEQVARALDAHPNAALIILTSPTYEGVVSDIGAICREAHARGVPVLIDAAHGAHLGFSDSFPPAVTESGADLVVTSLHKTLPALTQCALLLLSGSLIDETRLLANVNLFQTSSPSYILLASIDRCIRLLSENGTALFGAYAENLRAFDKRVTGLTKLSVLFRGIITPDDRIFACDPGKILISTRKAALDGFALAACLRAEYGIETEMAHVEYVLAMTSICDVPESFHKLTDALYAVDSRIAVSDTAYEKPILPELPKQTQTPGEAAELSGEAVPLEQAAGRMSLEYVWAYPPGVPFLVPGEMIDDEMVQTISRYIKLGFNLKSTHGNLPGQIHCAPGGT